MSLTDPKSLLIAVAIFLLIALSKITPFGKIWDNLAYFRAFIAPLMGLALGFVKLASEGNITIKGIVSYLGAGAGAIAINELIEAVKGIARGNHQKVVIEIKDPK